MRMQNNKFIFFLSVLFILSVNCSAFGKKIEKDSLECLEISGIITKDGKPQMDATIKLWLENEEVAALNIKKQYKFKFKLRKQSHYTIQVSKPGFVTRLISISTMLPPDVALDNLFRFYFELELIEDSPKVDPFYCDFPTAYISYDPKQDAFLNDTKYSARIKKAVLKH